MNFRRKQPKKRLASRGSWWKLWANVRRDFRQSKGESPVGVDYLRVRRKNQKEDE